MSFEGSEKEVGGFCGPQKARRGRPGGTDLGGLLPGCESGVCVMCVFGRRGANHGGDSRRRRQDGRKCGDGRFRFHVAAFA